MTMTPVKWVYSFLKKYKGKMVAGLAMTTGIALLTIVNPYILDSRKRDEDTTSRIAANP